MPIKGSKFITDFLRYLEYLKTSTEEIRHERVLKGILIKSEYIDINEMRDKCDFFQRISPLSENTYYLVFIDAKIKLVLDSRNSGLYFIEPISERNITIRNCRNFAILENQNLCFDEDSFVVESSESDLMHGYLENFILDISIVAFYGYVKLDFNIVCKAESETP